MAQSLGQHLQSLFCSKPCTRCLEATVTGRTGPFLREHSVAQLLMQPSQCPVCPAVGDSEKQDDTVVHKPSEDVLIHVSGKMLRTGLWLSR